jgi:FkbM family methyltransferase
VPSTLSPVPRVLRRAALGLLPAAWQIPLRYYYRRAFDLDRELSLVPGLVRPGSRAIDVGANLGVYTYALWKLGAEVEAFEPLSSMAAGLRAFARPRIRVHEVALSSTPGRQKLHFPTGDHGTLDLGRGSLSSSSTLQGGVEVTVRTLDEYDFTDVSFIKIDVEGHESAVLEGASRTLAKNRPNLLVEIEQRHLAVPVGTVLKGLLDQDYQGYFVQRGQLKSIKDFSWETHQRDVLDTPDYVNNFIFTPAV